MFYGAVLPDGVQLSLTSCHATLLTVFGRASSK
jgi:hypothetical protein